ncbi:MAG: 7-cyano-7-deazaguanine synthase QueC [Pseudomonadota bacterium]
MRPLDQAKALVLFSGGQDSSIALGWALDRFEKVFTVGFDYGQRHAVELGARRSVRSKIKDGFPQWRERLGEDTMIDLEGLGRISETALTRSSEIFLAENGLPTTFVPGRNLIFFTFAAALAYRLECGYLVGGMCETDFSGYPDCRAKTLDALAESIRLGTETSMMIETPLMSVSKAGSWAMAEDLGGDAFVELVRIHSHTCYQGVRGTLHEWGYGCGECPACELRAKGWRDFVAGKAS